MAQSINRVLLCGNLTRDPEAKYTPSGVAVLEMGIAVNSREKVQGEWTDRADFFDVRVWGNQAEACAQYLSKGSPVMVDGRLRLETWDLRDGSGKGRKVLVVADNVQFLPSRRDRDGGQQGEYGRPAERRADDFTAPPTVASGDFGGTDDDIPFVWTEWRGEEARERGCSYRQTPDVHLR